LELLVTPLSTPLLQQLQKLVVNVDDKHRADTLVYYENSALYQLPTHLLKTSLLRCFGNSWSKTVLVNKKRVINYWISHELLDQLCWLGASCKETVGVQCCY